MMHLSQKLDYIYYTGVGSRECPINVGKVMTEIASFLESEGYVLRSGGAPGADTFFERGVEFYKDIYLARRLDFGHDSHLHHVSEEALEMAKSIHPNWNAPGMRANNNRGQLLHGRNCYQVLGDNLDDPSKFLICWTENGEAKGGTRTAIKLAERHSVPILNLGSCKTGNYMEAFELFYMRYGKHE